VSFIAFVVAVLIGGLVVGGLARLAVPGPDPMPLWWTAALGIGGSVVGGIVSRVIFNTSVGFVGSVLFAVGLLVAYRHYVQKRPIWGPGARQPPG
jgi:uncharacterized membrane protein YeaQ/YmgE (transglycosylase-associated protein family)